MKVQDLIIGGGASGIAAAILLARKGRKVVVIEAQDRALKKVLASGNGRCNLSNTAISPDRYNAPDFVKPALAAFDGKLKDFFTSLGLELREEEGRIYPYSLSANNAVSALLRTALSSGAEIICGTKVKKIEKSGKLFRVYADGKEFESENLIFATGSNATSGFDSLSLLAPLGHGFTKRYASISYIPCHSVKGAAGVRARAALRLVCDDKDVFDGRGELLFKDNALSGILAFEASSRYVRALRKGKICKGIIDFVPDRTEKEVEEFLSTCGLTCIDALCAYLHRALAVAVAKRAGVEGKATDKAQKLAHALKNFTVDFEGNCDIKNAQAVCGGLELCDFDSRTLESGKVEGLYALGEALDVDGDCGGFNLHWAWASAYAAATAICGGQHV